MKSRDTDHPKKIISVRFYSSMSGAEPVKKWLKSLSAEQRKIIGEDIKTVEFGWPLGMPVVKSLEKKLWEVRSSFQDGIARVIFTLVEDQMILLHGFIKKTQKTPQKEIKLALQRAKEIKEA